MLPRSRKAVSSRSRSNCTGMRLPMLRERRDTGAIKGRNPACVGQDKASDCGCAWPKASDHLGDLTRKFYQTLDVHNAAGLGRKFVWAGGKSELQRLAAAD